VDNSGGARLAGEEAGRRAYAAGMAGHPIARPLFPDDDGTAAAGVGEVLTGYAEGRAGEYAVLAVLADTRLLVPVVPVLTEEETVGGRRRDKHSEMALPTLVGDDGRRAVLAFTHTASLTRWRPDARPVAVHARQAFQAALDEAADAVVVDVAGPVPYAIEGDRLRVLASGNAIGGPHEDPVVLAAAHAATRSLPGVAAVRVLPGERTGLAIRLRLDPAADQGATLRAAADRLAGGLPGHLTGGVELGLDA
jgi:hypothetical protein